MAKTALISSICRSEGGRCAAHPGWRPAAAPSSLSSILEAANSDLISFFVSRDKRLSLDREPPGLGVAGEVNMSEHASGGDTDARVAGFGASSSMVACGPYRVWHPVAGARKQVCANC